MFKSRRSLSAAFAIISLITMGSLLAGCQSSNHHKATQITNRKIHIVTSTNFYGEAAKAVAGDKATVTSVINSPTVDPHDYEPTTKVAKAVSQADIGVANGLNYDSWMNKLMNNNSSGQFIKVGETILGKKTGANPHLWYDPATMPKYANYLATQLGKLQPKNKAYFHHNAQRYISSLKPVNQEINQLKQVTNQTNSNQVYVSEPVFDYAIKALGYQVSNRSFENAVEKGTDPSPKSIHAMETGIKNHQIAFFVDNKQVTSKTVTNFVKLAQESNVPVLKVTETLPADMTYKQWMLSQYQQLNKILTDQTN